MLFAAKTAGLNVLRLMNDTSAIALAYGIYKQVHFCGHMNGDEALTVAVLFDIAILHCQLCFVSRHS